MTKIALDEVGISLSEVKSIGKLLHMRNQAGRKIKDPVMERNVIEWIKNQHAVFKRPISRKEI